MSKHITRKSVGNPLMQTLARTGFALLGGVKPLVRLLRESLEAKVDRYAMVWEHRLVIVLLRGFTAILAVSFIGLGILFTLIDIGGASRSVAYLICGFAGLILSFLRIQFKETKGRTS